MTTLRAVRYRSRPRSRDIAAVRRLVASSGAVFHREERAIALELLEERLARGVKSGYWFFFVEREDELLGYAAWGPVPLTRRSFDLYWIVVAPAAQGQGLGRSLLELVERGVAHRGGGNLYIETSSKPEYARTRRFYREAGYRRVAQLRNFYAPGDHKLMFCKVVRGLRWAARAAPRVLPVP